MFKVHLQLYQSLVIAQCNMFRNFEDKHWEDRYFPYRTVRDSGTCWSVPFWSCKSPRTISRPALHDVCLGSICESHAHLYCVILCNDWVIRICLGPDIDISPPFYVILLTSSSFHFRGHILSFRLWWSHWNLLRLMIYSLWDILHVTISDSDWPWLIGPWEIWMKF